MYRNIVQVVLVVCLLLLTSGRVDQDVLTTNNGTCIVRGVWGDSAFTITSSKLSVTLNYETAEIDLGIDLSSFATDMDSLENVLRDKKTERISFSGELTTGFIRTKAHPVQNFKIEGFVTNIESNLYCVGLGRLEHISEDLYSCILTLSFNLSLKELGWQMVHPKLGDKLYIEIHQTILKRRE